LNYALIQTINPVVVHEQQLSKIMKR